MSLRVRDVMSSKALTIDVSRTAAQAARMMRMGGVGSLVVTEDKRLAGAVTENDLVTRVMARGLDPDGVKVAEVMSQPLITTKPDITLGQVVRLMLSLGLEDLPVLGGSGGRDLVGTISLNDAALMFPALNDAYQQQQEGVELQVEEKPDYYVV